MRPSCYLCARKHISRASIKLEEAQLGYPEHIDLAIGELSEAESEIVAERPDLATLIRSHRKNLEASLDADPTGAGYKVPIMDLLKACHPVAVAVVPAKAAIVPAKAAIVPAKPPVVPPKRELSSQPARTGSKPTFNDIVGGPNPQPASKGGCSPCQAAAKLRTAASAWRQERTAGTLEHLVAVIVPLGDFNPAYSLVTVVLEQVRALSMLPRTRVALFIATNAKMDLLPPMPPNVGVFPLIPSIPAGQDSVQDKHVTAARAWLTNALASCEKATVFTHDLLHQAWFAHWAKALHELGTTPNFRFFHWAHSSVGSRPTTLEAQWRASVPAGHMLVALNSADLPYLQRYYQAGPESFVVLKNSRDVRVFYGMPQAAVELVNKHELHLADVLQVFPLSATRMEAKGLTKVIDVFRALTKLDEPPVCRLVVADAHANGKETETNRGLMRKYATDIGLPADVLVFVSESLGATDKHILTHGLDSVSIRCLLQLANVFIFPTTSEAGSLVLMEAALAGNLLVLNESLPCLADYISSTDAIWVPFGSKKEAAGAWSPSAVADRIEAELAQNKLNTAKRGIMRHHCLEAYRDALAPLLTAGLG